MARLPVTAADESAQFEGDYEVNETKGLLVRSTTGDPVVDRRKRGSTTR